ncbi:DUF1289 domain-containing protein [Sedimenticola selenatireducens]|uniref:DUF1289 domain-containing protein n=1 Tax=Sedimenticola selenatireducens TaxID=191960 RepID=A0A2N6D097_9GAMM|nr:DUF1289 domain-containing protein [Sedimenticola selenatireducens]PLX63086.1 MAG: DUF1289 domain-containing protein [Sedimenticola selenatireducens]
MDRDIYHRRYLVTQNEALHSPCVRMCTLDDNDICIGCGISLDEIKGWTSYSASTRAALLQLCRKRLAARPQLGLGDW